LAPAVSTLRVVRRILVRAVRTEGLPARVHRQETLGGVKAIAQYYAQDRKRSR